MYLIKSLGSSHIITTFVTGLSLGKNRGLHNFIKGDYNLDINSKIYPLKINEEKKDKSWRKVFQEHMARTKWIGGVADMNRFKAGPYTRFLS